MAKVPNGRLITMPASSQSFGHSNVYHPETWKDHVAEFLKSLP